MKYCILFLSFLLLMSCAAFQPKTFTQNALDEELLTIDRKPITFKDILAKNSEKELFIQVFATYCPISQGSFYDVVEFQKENPHKTYIFLSVDHNYYDWKRGLKDIEPKGQFYYIPKKGEGALAEFLQLKTIPRFLKVDKKGNIQVFKTAKVSSKLK